MPPPETSGSRSVHSNIDEAEEHDLRNNFMKIIEALKEETKKFLDEVKDKTNKKLKEINKSLKSKKAKNKKQSYR